MCKDQDFYKAIVNGYALYGDKAITDWKLGFSHVYEKCQPLDGKIVLDYGCGDGKFARFLRDKGARVIGVDVSDAMITLAKKQNSTDINYYAIESGNLSFLKSETIDCIVINFVLCILDKQKDILNILHEMYRVLKKNRYVIMLNVNWDKSQGKEFISFKLGNYEEFYFGQPLEVILKGEHEIKVKEHYWSIEKYCSFFAESKFTVTNIEEPLGMVGDEQWIDEVNSPPFSIITAVKL